jgi:ribosomal protein S18 acetylase RimI-like enzyme
VASCSAVPVVVRPARPGDGEGIARCHLDSAATYVERAPELFRMPDEDGFVEWIEADLAEEHGAGFVALVAEVEGAIAGHLEARMLEPIDSARWQSVRDVGIRRLIVDALAVAGAHRRRGAGRELMAAAEEWGRERDAEAVLLDTWVDSELSVPFYESLGYRRRALRFEKPLVEG